MRWHWYVYLGPFLNEEYLDLTNTLRCHRGGKQFTQEAPLAPPRATTAHCFLAAARRSISGRTEVSMDSCKARFVAVC